MRAGGVCDGGADGCGKRGTGGKLGRGGCELELTSVFRELQLADWTIQLGARDVSVWGYGCALCDVYLLHDCGGRLFLLSQKELLQKPRLITTQPSGHSTQNFIASLNLPFAI